MEEVTFLCSFSCALNFVFINILFMNISIPTFMATGRPSIARSPKGSPVLFSQAQHQVMRKEV